MDKLKQLIGVEFKNSKELEKKILKLLRTKNINIYNNFEDLSILYKNTEYYVNIQKVKNSVKVVDIIIIPLNNYNII